MEPSAVDEAVCTYWQRTMQIAIGAFLLAGALLAAHYYNPPRDNQLQQQVQQLTNEVHQLRQQEEMPSLVLSRYRDSICYIFGVYRVGFPGRTPTLHMRVSGTGFLVKKDLLATNRHVIQPWYGDPEAEELIARGAVPYIEKMVAFFPSSPTPVNITNVELSDKMDLAVAHIPDSSRTRSLQSLPLAPHPSMPGEIVSVVGYPMGILGMVAKSPTAIYDRLAYRRDDITAANELAALSLIRPSATYGHLGDVVGDKLIYDAPTAHGGSGGPVFNAAGEVIGINSAYIDGFSGGTLGISSEALRPLIQAAEKNATESNNPLPRIKTAAKTTIAQ